MDTEKKLKVAFAFRADGYVADRRVISKMTEIELAKFKTAIEEKKWQIDTAYPWEVSLGLGNTTGYLVIIPREERNRVEEDSNKWINDLIGE